MPIPAPRRKLLGSALLIAAATAPALRSSAAEDAGVPLFNGVDLAGWHNVNGAPDTWTVRDGMIVCSGHPTGVLRTDRMYENFVLELEYRHLHAGGNAGLFIWSDPLTARGQPFTRSIEVQVMDGHETPNYTSHGDVFSIHGARMRPDRPHPAGWERCLPSERRAKPAPEWNHYRVTCNEGALKLEVNGKEVSGASAIEPRKGYICLESEGSECHFRNVRLRELPVTAPPVPASQVADAARGFRSLFNGRDLAGWSEVEDAAGHWKAQDWVLDYDGKGGDLWSDEEFGDFELIADWRWSGPAHEAAVPDIRRDGTQAVDTAGAPVTVRVQEAGDSGIYLRGSSKSQVNIWCWPVGSGEVYGYRTDMALPAQVRAGVTPNATADAPIGEWNRFHVTMRGDRLTVVLNGTTVLDGAQLPGVAPRGKLALQNHGWPIQFANLYVRELSAPVPEHVATMPAPHSEARAALLAGRARARDAAVAFVGDSITEGWEGAGRAVWDARFAPLGAINLGISGDRTEHVLWRFRRGDYDGLHPAAAVVMIGTNNLGSGHAPEQVADGVRAIVDEMRDRWPSARVLLLGVFPRGQAQSDAFREQVRALNSRLKGVADDRRVFFKDIGAGFLEPDGALSPEVMPDFLHLSERGYGIWADAIAQDLARLLPRG